MGMALPRVRRINVPDRPPCFFRLAKRKSGQSEVLHRDSSSMECNCVSSAELEIGNAAADGSFRRVAMAVGRHYRSGLGGRHDE